MPTTDSSQSAPLSATDGPIVLEKVQITPSGNLLLVTFIKNDGSAHPDHAAMMRSVPHQPTLTIDGKPFALTGTANWYRGAKFIWWALNKSCKRMMDDEDAAVVRGGSGWSEVDGLQDSITINARMARSDDPKASITYPFKDIIPGRYRVSITHNGNPSQTPDALYSVMDGTKVAGTAHFDQRQLDPRYDRPDFIDWTQTYCWTDVVESVVVAGTSFSVVITNKAGTGGLVSDGVRIERIHDPIVPRGAKVTLDAPAGWATTDAGDAAAAVAVPVEVTTDDTFFPVDESIPNRMKIGYNPGVGKLVASSNENFYADRMRQAVGWQGVDSAGNRLWPIDADGRLTSIPAGGYATNEFVVTTSNWVDNRDRFVAPPGTWWLRYDPGSSPTIDIGTSDGGMIGPLSPPVADPVTKKLVREFTVTWPPHNPAWAPTFRCNQGLAVQVSGELVHGLEIFDPTVPRDWSSPWHPIFLDRVKGRGFECLRGMDPMEANSSNVHEFAEMPNERTATLSHHYSRYVEIASIEPVDATAADVDDVRKYLSTKAGGDPGTDGRAVVRVRTLTPHGCTSGQSVMITLDRNSFSSTGTPGSTLAFETTFGSMIFATSPTTLTVIPNYYGDTPDPMPDFPITTAETVDCTKMASHYLILQLGSGMSPADFFRLNEDCGLNPWFNIPTMASRDCNVQLATIAAKTMAPGRKVYLETANEPWNFSVVFRQSYWFQFLGHYLTYWSKQGHTPTDAQPGLYADSEPFAYAYTSSQNAQIWRDTFVSLGRPDTDVVSVLNAQTGWPGMSVDPYCDFYSGYNLRPMDAFAVAYYDGTNPDRSGYMSEGSGSIDQAAADLDIDGFIDLAGIGAYHYCMSNWMAENRKSQNATRFNGKFANVPYVAYEGGLHTYDMISASDPPNTANFPRMRLNNAAAARSPRIRRFTRSWCQMVQAPPIGLDLMVRFTLSECSGGSEGEQWRDFEGPYQAAGTGLEILADGRTANANPWDHMRIVSVQGLAHREWASSVSVSTYTLTGPATVAVGSPATYVVTPGKPFTGTITAHVTGGTLSGGILTFNNSNAPQTFTVTPTDTTMIKISATNSGSLTDPPAITLTATAADVGAKTYTLTGPATATTTVGVAVTFTVTPDGPFTGTITPAAAKGTFSPTALTYAKEATAKTFTYTPTAAGIMTITTTNNGSLKDPQGISLTVAPAATASYTIGGPTSVAVGTPATFTVTPVNGPITGTITVKASAGTVGKGTLTFTNSSTAQTFTVTPTTAGTITVSTTNDGGLTDPHSITLTATAVAKARYSIAGLTSVAVGSPATFTVTPIDGPLTATITAHASAGKVEHGTMAFANSSTAQTFSVIPAAAGKITVSTTNDQSLKDPASITLTATGAASGAKGYTLTGPATVAVNAPATFVVTPDGPFTGTITASASEGTVAGGKMAFANSSAPQSFTVTPKSAKPITVTCTNEKSLKDPPALVLKPTTPPATEIRLTAPHESKVGVPQSVSVELDWPGNVTVTLSATGGEIKPSSLTFVDSAGPLTATFTPNAAGKATISVGVAGNLVLPKPASMQISQGKPKAAGPGKDKGKG